MDGPAIFTEGEESVLEGSEGQTNSMKTYHTVFTKDEGQGEGRNDDGQVSYGLAGRRRTSCNQPREVLQRIGIENAECRTLDGMLNKNFNNVPLGM